MTWGAALGGIASLVGTGYSIYQNEKQRDEIKNNPGTQQTASISRALLDPNDPTYRTIFAEEQGSIYADLIGAIQRGDIMRRRGAAAGNNFVRSEREDESRHKAIMDAATQANQIAGTNSRARLTGALGASQSLASQSALQTAGAHEARQNTVKAMVDLTKAISRNESVTNLVSSLGSSGSSSGSVTGGGNSSTGASGYDYWEG